jgi:hypothetical protein
VSGALALRPPRTSVLPPGAGNKAKKAVQPKEERAKKPEERYVDQSGILHRHVHAAAIRRHGDGDAAAITTVEQTQDMVSDTLSQGATIARGSAAVRAV